MHKRHHNKTLLRHINQNTNTSWNVAQSLRTGEVMTATLSHWVSLTAIYYLIIYPIHHKTHFTRSLWPLHRGLKPFVTCNNEAHSGAKLVFMFILTYNMKVLCISLAFSWISAQKTFRGADVMEWFRKQICTDKKIKLRRIRRNVKSFDR